MKTPIKVIAQISLPLMFVLFVMAAFVFAVSPVLAQDQCGPLSFCDRDGDSLFKDHKRCFGCPDYADNIDCNDDDFNDEENPCNGSSSDGDVYTAQLTAGAFRFVDGGGNRVLPIYVTTPSNTDNRLVPLFETDVEMWRPGCPDEPIDYPTTKPGGNVDIDGPGPWANPGWETCTYKCEDASLEGTCTGDWIPDWDAVAFDQATWDRMFEIGCPELGTSDTYKIDKIISTYGDWDFAEPGNYRLILRDIRVYAAPGRELGGQAWDVTMQLIGPENYTPYIYYLPIDGDAHFFVLERGRMWGREVGGGPGGRKSCHEADSSKDSKMEGFYLCEQASPEGTCEPEANGDASAVMEIVGPVVY